MRTTVSVYPDLPRCVLRETGPAEDDLALLAFPLVEAVDAAAVARAVADLPLEREADRALIRADAEAERWRLLRLLSACRLRHAAASSSGQRRSEFFQSRSCAA